MTRPGASRRITMGAWVTIGSRWSWVPAAASWAACGAGGRVARWWWGGRFARSRLACAAAAARLHGAESRGAFRDVAWSRTPGLGRRGLTQSRVAGRWMTTRLRTDDRRRSPRYEVPRNPRMAARGNLARWWNAIRRPFRPRAWKSRARNGGEFTTSPSPRLSRAATPPPQRQRPVMTSAAALPSRPARSPAPSAGDASAASGRALASDDGAREQRRSAQSPRG